MKCLLPIGSRFAIPCLLAVLALPLGMGQSSPQLIASTGKDLATVRSVQVVPGRDGLAIEIIASRPLTPSITKADNPPRLVIDLPRALSSENKGRIEVQNGQIRGLRVALHQSDPPVTRVVVDLVRPVGYTWDAAGNRLMVRLQSAQPEPVKPPTVPAFTQGLQPAAVPLSSGSIVLASDSLAPGSSVTAGSDTTIVRLARGGEVRVCPGTTVSVTSSKNSAALMLGISTGALEAHYTLDASADSILTPDFRVLLPGPGEFHYAISADSRGNTCVRALPGNTASVIVSELLGDGTYQVKPEEQVVFHSGRLNLADAVVPIGCGCPAPSAPVLRASATSPVVSDAKLPPSVPLGQPGDEKLTSREVSQPGGQDQLPLAAQVKLAAARSETAPLPPSKPNEIHVQIDAPFVFRASDIPPSSPPAPAAPVHEAQLLPVSYRPRPAVMQTAVLAPPPTRPVHHGFFAKVKNFFSAIFG